MGSRALSFMNTLQLILILCTDLNQNNQSALHPPRILLIDGGTVVAVRFNEAFTVISLAQGKRIDRFLMGPI